MLPRVPTRTRWRPAWSTPQRTIGMPLGSVEGAGGCRRWRRVTSRLLSRRRSPWVPPTTASPSPCRSGAGCPARHWRTGGFRCQRRCPACNRARSVRNRQVSWGPRRPWPVASGQLDSARKLAVDDTLHSLHGQTPTGHASVEAQPRHLGHTLPREGAHLGAEGVSSAPTVPMISEKIRPRSSPKLACALVRT